MDLLTLGPALAVVLVDWVVRVALLVRVVMRRSAVPVALAWVGLLVTAPFLGIVLYLMFGENRLGTRRLARYEAVSREMDEKAYAIWSHRSLAAESPSERFRSVARYATAVSGVPPLTGNRLKVYSGSADFLDALIADIDAATRHVHLHFYIWMVGGAGDRVADAAVRAAQRGVTVRVLVDAVGSRPFLRSGTVQRLRDAGVRVVAALPVNPFRAIFARLDLRNHRKIVVIDGRAAYTGSQNLTDDSFRSNPRRDVGSWIDAMARVEGPAALALQVIFLKDWALDAPPGDDPRADESCLPDLPPAADAEGAHGSVVQVIPSGPGRGPQEGAIQRVILQMIHHAEEEVFITTPYFVPDEETKTALVSAAVRGVSVSIVVPARLDTPIVAAASRAHYEDLLEAGVKMLEYPLGLLHAKTVVVDRDVAIIGSANIDMRSFALNFEATLLVHDGEVASLIRFMQVGYASQSAEVSLNAWRRRPALRRFADNVAKLAGPLL